MLRNIFRRYRREPLANIAVSIFAAILTVVVCYLQQAQEEELRSFEETYMTVPVYFSVTDLDGSQLRGAKSIEGWIVDLFYPNSRLGMDLYPYVKDLKIRLELRGISGEMHWEDEEDYFRQLNQIKYVKLAGISTLRVAEELTAERGGAVRWYEGYSEEILGSEEFVCLVGEEYEGEEVVLSFVYEDTMTGERLVYVCTLKVVGRYTDEGNEGVYCPYLTLEEIYAKINKEKTIQCISATLSDNNLIDDLKTTASYWFAKPNPTGEATPWGRFGYEHYLYALDIDDTLLQNLVARLEASMTVNRVSSVLIFAMSALAGFLVGFLVIRSRRREILLMRTLGSSDGSIYVQLAIEQLMCIIVGVLLGGGYTLWKPLWKLVLFVALNFAGLSTALLVFLHSNLLSAAKEEE